MPGRSRDDIEHLLESLDAALLAQDTSETEAILEQLSGSERDAPGVLVDRIVAGRAEIPTAALMMLATVAGERAPKYLRQVARATQLPDDVRLAAQMMAGWPEHGESRQRLKFLRSLSDPVQALLAGAREGGEHWPHRNHLLADVVAYLSALPVDERSGVIERLTDEVGRHAVWTLAPLVHSDDASSQRQAIDALERLGATEAVGALERCAATARDAGVREAAAVAAERLCGAGAPAPEVYSLPPVDHVRLSTADSTGSQIATIIRCEDEETCLLVSFYVTLDDGLLDAVGAGAASDEFDLLESVFDAEGVDLVDVDLAAVRGLLADAVARSAAAGAGLPPLFELWEPLVHEPYPPPRDEPVVTPELNEVRVTLTAAQPDTGRAGRQLIDHPFFDRWSFEPDLLAAALFTLPNPPSERGFRERDYIALLDRLLDSRTCDHLRRGLRRQAWLLEQDGETRLRDVALGLAATLTAPDPARMARSPFWTGMVDRAGAALAETLLLPPEY